MKIERVWAMPNKNTFIINPIKHLLDEEVFGLILDPFCGEFSPANLKNDLNPKIFADSHMDALLFLGSIKSDSFDCILFDPPYSIRQAKECYDSFGVDKLDITPNSMNYWSECKNQIARILKVGGKAICFGWSSMGIGINRGFEMTRILMVPHGGSRNDTICTVEIKKCIHCREFMKTKKGFCFCECPSQISKS